MDGFDYAGWLKRHLMAGQIDPWRKTDKRKPMYTLLVSVEIAMEECKGWSRQEFSRHDFINYLKVNDIIVFNNIDEFVDWRKVREEQEVSERKPKLKRIVSEEEKIRRKEQMKQINEKKTNQSL